MDRRKKKIAVSLETGRWAYLGVVRGDHIAAAAASAACQLRHRNHGRERHHDKQPHHHHHLFYNFSLSGMPRSGL